MISLNKFSFGSPENFVNAYLTPDYSQIIVVVKDTSLTYPSIWLDGHLADHDKTTFTFDIPDEFSRDVRLFIKGKYSQMSEKTKDMIRLYSGLHNKKEKIKPDGSKVYDTDARIRALDRDEELRQTMEDFLDYTFGEQDELISPPGSDEILLKGLEL